MNEPIASCPLCDSANIRVEHSGLPIIITCNRCGRFRTREHLFDAIKDYADRYLLSGVTRELTDRDQVRRPWVLDDDRFAGRTIADDKFDEIVRFAPRSVVERSERLLMALARQSKHPGDLVGIDYTTDYPLAYAKNGAECRFYVKHLIDSELLDDPRNETLDGKLTVSVSSKGWQAIEQLQKTGIRSDQGFIAMSFAPDLNDAYHSGLHVGIEQAGFRPARVDKEEFIDGIFDKVIALIRQSRFVVADLTGMKPNVYLEVGFAQGLGLPVIPTCRDSDIGTVQFDLKHLNVIVWKTPAELAERLKNRIAAVIGIGPLATESAT